MRAIGPPLTDVERAAFVKAARSYLGVPFRHQGRSRRGLDCAGLFVAAISDIGRTFFNVAAYSREPLNSGLRTAVVTNLGDPIQKADMREGDVALMRFRGEPSHVGIITNYPLGGFALLHTFAQMKKVVEHRIDEEWMRNIVGVWRP